ncbi:23S rRNA (pseudouridine(1915)-N(3))-methyltransferase RlmH [Ahrensia marina]|uniref:Ribosomal RNA large subunit methyltransferase H n=1 Tax=Ahrensia marina TaxID=1514904 RepID=A0A0M9GKS5_9HYPH|nr:23S rRNA (pseudouridine(1915)-N(3))-methyltransferase RlmH [Ahrensia marina]KPB00107.1 50S rRNA methyltransferase [Ahrensia marina]
MQLVLFCVGRLKKGPERELVERYLDRLAKTGPQCGLNFGGVTEIVESRAQTAEQRKAEESARCRELVSDPRSALLLFDERGKALGSRDFAGKIGDLRDQGIQTLVAAIGGPDGHEPGLANDAHMVVALGKLTWPHQVARILVAEQLYRASAILNNHPYHRD